MSNAIIGNNSAASTLTDLDILSTEYPAPAFIIPGLIPLGLTIFAGKPKTKKSMMAMDMCFAVASGGRFLDADVEQHEVLYLALEDSEPRIQSRLRAMIGDSIGTGKLYFETKWNRLDAGCMEDLEKWIQQHPHVKLIIIDTLNRIRGFTRQGLSIAEKDYGEIGKLKNFCDRHSIAVILIHHLRKSESQDVLDMISGSTGLTGAADTLIVLKKDRGEESAQLFVTGRDIEDRNIHLTFNKECLSWEVANIRTNMSPERAEILEIITRAAKPLKLAEIAATAGKKLTTVYKLVSHLVESNYIEKTGYGHYQIVQDEEQAVNQDTEPSSNIDAILTADPTENFQEMIVS
jgi:RecA-family ATPase